MIAKRLKSSPHKHILYKCEHTVPDIETRIVPYRVPNINPADIVKGTAGMASTCTSKYQNYETRDTVATPAKLLRKTSRELLRPLVH